MTYNASSIRHLKGLEAVRMRPGMWLGDPTSGDALHHCIKEVVDNSVDEHLAGHCSEVTIRLESDGVVEVSDNGRGIPVDLHPEEGVSALEVVMTNLSAGGKFDHDSYETSAGLHGVGVSAVNAVSEWLRARVERDGAAWEQSYKAGIPDGPVAETGKSKRHGTTITWKRDLTVFSGTVEYDYKTVAERLQELAFLNPGLKLTLIDSRKEKVRTTEYHYVGGIKEYVVDVLGKKTVLTPVLAFRLGNTEIAMAWTIVDGEEIRCYANNTFNRDGGTHLTGFKNGLTRVVTTYAKEHNMLKDLGDEGITGNDIRDGIVAVVNVRIPDVSFSSQTKDKLVSPRAKTLVEDLIMDQVAAYMEANPGVAKKIAEKAVTSAKAREAARRARESVKRKDFLDPMSLPGKLSDCRSKDPKRSELFIVEGASAAGCLDGDTMIMLEGGVPNAIGVMAYGHKLGIKHTVYSYDSNTGQVVPTRVVNVWCTKHAEVVEVWLTNGTVVKATADHRFLRKDGTYCPAIDLQLNEELVPTCGMKLGVQAPCPRVARILRQGEMQPVYDIEVEGPHHNFALYAGVFVHNSAKGGRDSEFQAILPLRGKVLNAERASAEDILDNGELGTLIGVLGCGIEQTGGFNYEKLRYHKILLMTDSDVDGAHIRTLLLTFIYRCMPRLIYNGNIYIAQPPLYGARHSLRGEALYFLGDAELNAYRASLPEEGAVSKKTLKIQRYKGLGEMNAEDLAVTTMDPTNRQILQVTVDDAAAAERYFDLLMGDNVSSRRDWIEDHAQYAGRIDT